MSLKLNKLPKETYLELAEYLPVQSWRVLSQTCQSLRDIYLILSWSSCRMTFRNTEGALNATIREISQYQVLNPTKYSWFLNSSVKKIQINAADMRWGYADDTNFFNNQFPLELFPSLDSLNLSVSYFDLLLLTKKRFFTSITLNPNLPLKINLNIQEDFEIQNDEEDTTFCNPILSKYIVDTNIIKPNQWPFPQLTFENLSRLTICLGQLPSTIDLFDHFPNVKELDVHCPYASESNGFYVPSDLALLSRFPASRFTKCSIDISNPGPLDFQPLLLLLNQDTTQTYSIPCVTHLDFMFDDVFNLNLFLKIFNFPNAIEISGSNFDLTAVLEPEWYPQVTEIQTQIDDLSSNARYENLEKIFKLSSVRSIFIDLEYVDSFMSPVCNVLLTDCPFDLDTPREELYKHFSSRFKIENFSDVNLYKTKNTIKLFTLIDDEKASIKRYFDHMFRLKDFIFENMIDLIKSPKSLLNLNGCSESIYFYRPALLEYIFQQIAETPTVTSLFIFFEDDINWSPGLKRLCSGHSSLEQITIELKGNYKAARDYRELRIPKVGNRYPLESRGTQKIFYDLKNPDYVYDPIDIQQLEYLPAAPRYTSRDRGDFIKEDMGYVNFPAFERILEESYSSSSDGIFSNRYDF